MVLFTPQLLFILLSTVAVLLLLLRSVMGIEDYVESNTKCTQMRMCAICCQLALE